MSESKRSSKIKKSRKKIKKIDKIKKRTDKKKISAKMVDGEERKRVFRRHIEIFTDGSCMNRPEGMRCGYGVHFYKLKAKDISKKFTHNPLTNQRAELYAIYRGIGTVINRYRFNKLTVYTDSAYSIGCLTLWIDNWKKNDWKTSNKKDVKNRDIIQKIDKYLTLPQYSNKIHFEHIKAHTGKTDYKSMGNAMADKLATDGAMS